MIAVGITLLLVLLDQWTKIMALSRLKPLGSVPVLPGILNFTFVENRGAAFGIMNGMRWFFVALTVPVVAAMIYYYRKLPKEKPYLFVRMALVAIIAGAVGNFIDRLVRGYVVDFIHVSFIDFPVFNVADCFVTIGAGALCVLLLFVVKEP